MTTPTSEDPFPPQHAVIQEAPAPFEDEFHTELTKPVNMEQLTDEINKATSSNVTLAISGPLSGNAEISEDNPAILYVTPSKINQQKLFKVIEDHRPDATFDVPEQEQAFRSVLQKVISDPTAALDDDEVRAGLHGLLLREANRNSAPQA